MVDGISRDLKEGKFEYSIMDMMMAETSLSACIYHSHGENCRSSFASSLLSDIYLRQREQQAKYLRLRYERRALQYYIVEDRYSL